MGKSFNSKQELIDFIYKQCNVVLNNESGVLGECDGLLYTRIPQACLNSVLSVLNKYGIQHNEHLHNKYWIYLNN